MSQAFLHPARVAALVVLLAIPLSACGRGKAPKGGPGSADPPTAADSTAATSAIPVEVVRLSRGPMESILRSSANLEAESRIQVVSEAARRVREILFEEGDPVQKGQLLLRLQNDEQKSAVEKARARLEHSRLEVKRQEELQKKGLTTEQALIDARYNFEQDRLSLEDAQRSLSYTEVRAPISGTVTQRLVSVGDNVTVGQPLLEIIDFSSMVARIYLPEKNLPRLKVGQKARIVAKAVREEPYEGRVLRISPVVDAASGTVKVTVKVGDQPGLRPGLFVNVALVTAVNHEALRLPKRALIYDNDQIFAFRLLPDHTVEKLRVVVGLSGKDHVEPLTSFAEGDSVVVAGQAALKNHSKVRVVRGATGADTEDAPADDSTESTGPRAAPNGARQP